MEDSTIDKIINKIPYGDGTGRRRFVAGAIVLLLMLVIHWEDLSTDKFQLVGLTWKDLITSPTLLIAAVLVVYAIGNLVELIGESFLVEIVGAPFTAIDFIREKTLNKEYKIAAVFIVITPILLLTLPILSIFGFRQITLRVQFSLSDTAKDYFIRMTKTLKEYFVQPAGEGSSMAYKYIIDLFEDETDRIWARKLVNRNRDILVLTTALFLVISYSILSGRLDTFKRSDLFVEDVDNLISMADSLIIREYIGYDDKRALLYFRDKLNDYKTEDEFDAVGKGGTEFFKSNERLLSYLVELDSSISADPGLIGEGLLINKRIHLLELIKSYDSIELGYFNLQNKMIEDNTTINSLLFYLKRGIILIPFFFLFTAYFSSVKGTIVSILEMHVVRETPLEKFGKPEDK